MSENGTVYKGMKRPKGRGWRSTLCTAGCGRVAAWVNGAGWTVQAVCLGCYCAALGLEIPASRAASDR